MRGRNERIIFHDENFSQDGTSCVIRGTAPHPRTFHRGSVSNDSIKKVGQPTNTAAAIDPRDSVYPARSVFFPRHQTIEIGSTHRNEQ